MLLYPLIVVQLLLHDVVFDPLDFLDKTLLFFDSALNQDVVLAELLAQLQHNLSLLFAGLFNKLRKF